MCVRIFFLGHWFPKRVRGSPDLQVGCEGLRSTLCVLPPLNPPPVGCYYSRNPLRSRRSLGRRWVLVGFRVFDRLGYLPAIPEKSHSCRNAYFPNINVLSNLSLEVRILQEGGRWVGS